MLRNTYSDFKMTSDTHRNEYVWNKTMYFCLAIRNGLIASGWSPIHLDAHIVLRQTRLPGQSMLIIYLLSYICT